MKKDKSGKVSEMREEYDFSRGVRGKYANRFARGSNVIVLDPDVAAFFPTSKDVNKALRALADLAAKNTKRAPSADPD